MRSHKPLQQPHQQALRQAPLQALRQPSQQVLQQPPYEPLQKPRRKYLRAFFLALACLGLAVPWYFNTVYFLSGGSVMPDVFWSDAFANALTTGITLDVYLAAVAFSAWVAADRRLGAWCWAYIAACFGIGLAFVMPLYLAQRLRTVSGDA